VKPVKNTRKGDNCELQWKSSRPTQEGKEWPKVHVNFRAGSRRLPNQKGGAWGQGGGGRQKKPKVNPLTPHAWEKKKREEKGGTRRMLEPPDFRATQFGWL